MQLKSVPWKTLVILTAIASLSPTTTVKATDSNPEINMSQLTCGEFIQMDRMQKVMSLVWYDGWLSQQQGNVMFTPERSVISSLKDSLESACENKQDDLVLNQLQN